MKLPVYLAIPNYNMGSQLDNILPSVIGRGYERIYVLDDCSTDDSAQIVSKYHKDGVRFISSERNLGAAANRNKILDYEKAGIVHFIDADAVLQGKNKVVNDINDAFDRNPDAAVIGFQIFNTDGSQFDWNFGPVHKRGDGITWLSFEINKRSHNKIFKKFLRLLFKKKWANYWTYTHPESAEQEQQVGAVSECNMAVRLGDFNKVGGFDGSLRYHEIHSLAYKLNSINKKIWYVPAIPVSVSSNVDVRPHRNRDFRKSQTLLDFKRFTGQYKIKS